jgi:hypothetical protein
MDQQYEEEEEEEEQKIKTKRTKVEEALKAEASAIEPKVKYTMIPFRYLGSEQLKRFEEAVSEYAVVYTKEKRYGDDVVGLMAISFSPILSLVMIKSPELANVMELFIGNSIVKAFPLNEGELEQIMKCSDDHNEGVLVYAFKEAF